MQKELYWLQHVSIFFELKNYTKAETYFEQLSKEASTQENKLEAMRGLLRSQYQLQKWTEAAANAKELAVAKGSSSDDKALANMAIAKSFEVDGQYDQAIANFKTVVQLNKAALAAEARYEIANCWFALNKLSDAEKAAFEVINKSGSYDYWVTKAYIFWVMFILNKRIISMQKPLSRVLWITP